MAESANSSGRVAALVVTFHRPAGLNSALRALHAQIHRPDVVYVMDNGGDAVIDEVFEIEVRLIRVGSNSGAAGGFAIGMQAAVDDGYDWLFLINDDDRPRPEAIHDLLELVGQRPHPCVAMGWVNLSGVVIPTGAVWHRGLRYPDWLVNATEPYTVDVITFGGLLVPSAAVRDIGVPRSDFFMMWEEYEFCLRLRGAGWKILVLPRPLVDIDGLPPGSRSAPWRAYYDARNSWITVRDFAGWDTRLWWLVRQIKFCLGTLPAPDRWSRLRFRTRGMLHGWRGTTGTTVIP